MDLLERWSRGEAADVLQLVLTIALGVAVATLLPAVLVGGRRARSLGAPRAAGQAIGSATTISSP